jgi:hypothetical protein
MTYPHRAFGHSGVFYKPACQPSPAANATERMELLKNHVTAYQFRRQRDSSELTRFGVR